MTTFWVGNQQRTLVFFSDNDGHITFDQGGDFPYAKYSDCEEGLLYLRTHSKYFGGPFYGFTPGTKPDGGNFKPDLFFVHGPTFVGKEQQNRNGVEALLKDTQAKQRLIDALEAVLDKRYVQEIEKKYQFDTSQFQTCVNTRYRVAERAKLQVEQHMNSTSNYYHYNFDVDRYNTLMSTFDETSRLLEDACNRRNDYIRQMNHYHELSTKQANDFNTLNTKFVNISKKQTDLQQQMAGMAAKIDKGQGVDEVQKEINNKLDSITSFMSGISIGAGSTNGAKKQNGNQKNGSK